MFIVSPYKIDFSSLCVFYFQITFVIYICLFMFESFPTGLVLCGIVSQVLHFCLLQSFPFFTVTSPQFIAAVGMFDINLIITCFMLISSVYIRDVYDMLILPNIESCLHVRKFRRYNLGTSEFVA